MPAGVSWFSYLKHATVAMLFMMAGAQTVHLIYRPLDDLEDLVRAEKEKLQLKEPSSSSSNNNNNNSNSSTVTDSQGPPS
ncbi:uncharacterized protein LOC106876313 [Octopus bimaculoides]|uniref:Uncharacterized protein n=1 Tax=Octopus bimaculoides TaxID=37653 RepID=A0A0L8GL98_OCTBM|nr:uncharacterized protein LOC106876313 [Octopus bimaculoides]|eukprot:XP_014780298.1 PREDICTED: uncharacterized protein LOC106876313 [Octopus bimaculoides]